MTEHNELAIRQIQTINSFKKQFFQKFGMDIDVSTRLPSYAINGVELQDVDMKLVSRVLNEHIPADIRIKHPQYTVFSKTRLRGIVELRHIFMKIAREKNFTLKHIASMCGVEHHSTVIHGADTANDLLLTDSKFLALYNEIINQIKLVYTQENARTNQPADTPQADTQSAAVIALYPGKHTSWPSGTATDGRSPNLSKEWMDNTREPARVQGFAGVAGS